MKNIQELQKTTCEKYNLNYIPSPENLKIGISKNTVTGAYPLHGLRHNIDGGTTGWYIWSGEWSDDPHFFEPLHVFHLERRCPELLKYLGFPPGTRFLIMKDHQDIWTDPSLLSF